MPETDYGDRPAVQRARREHPLAAGADRGLDTQRRERARIARPALPAREAGDVLGALRDHPHVAARGADVLGGDVAAAERLHRVGEVEQRRGPVLGGENARGGGHDHALAAAERQVRDRGLVGHRPRQPQRVPQRLARVVISPHPAPAQRRAADGRVHRDERVQAGAPPAVDEHVLVIERLQVTVDRRIRLGVAGSIRARPAHGAGGGSRPPRGVARRSGTGRGALRAARACARARRTGRRSGALLSGRARAARRLARARRRGARRRRRWRFRSRTQPSVWPSTVESAPAPFGVAPPPPIIVEVPPGGLQTSAWSAP